MNANKAMAARQVTIAGQQYTIEFSMASLIQLEREAKLNAFDFGIYVNAGPETIARLLWAGLLKHHKLSFDQVLQLLDDVAPDELNQLFPDIQAAHADASPEPQTEEEKKSSATAPTNTAESTGSASTV